MEHLYLSNQKLAYFDNKKSTRPIVFVHGNSLSSKTFLHQLKDPALNKYRLIALDLPGHGDSSIADEPEKMYSVSGFISVLQEFVEELDLHDAVFVGHSLGGHIVLDASPRLSTAKGFVLFGTPPIALPPQMEKYFLPNPAFPLAYKPDLSNDEVDTLASAFVNNEEEKPKIIEDIKGTHPEMRAYLGASMTPENMTNEVDIIENISKPLAIFHGKNDKLVNGEYFNELNIPVLWEDEIKIIPDSGHCPQLENPEYFNRKLIEFITHVF